MLYAPVAAAGRLRRRPAERAAVPDHPPLPEPGVRRAGALLLVLTVWQLMLDVARPGRCQMMLVLALAPLLAGYVRKVKARLVAAQGPPLIQPYRDLLRLLRKEVVLAR